jgi:hypothetical protein
MVQRPLVGSNAFNGPAAQAPVPYGQYTQLPGGFGQLGGNGGVSQLPFGASPFFFPQNSQFFSNQVPTIGKALPRSSTSSIRTVDPITTTSTTGTTNGTEGGNGNVGGGGSTCPHSILGDISSSFPKLNNSVLLTESHGGNTPSQSKKILTF